MIRPIDIKLNAAHPELPLVEATTFTGAPSSVFIRGVPKSVGNWSITAVNVAVTYPDNSTTTRAAVESAEGVWVATIPGTATSGRTAAGFKIMADGIDENGAAVTGYVLGFADFSVLSFTPAPAPGGTFWLLRYFDAMPTTPKKGDVAKVDGALKFYNGSAWEPFDALDDAVTRTSANGVKSSGIWSAIWGALSALPTGFTSLYDWCVSQLAGKANKSDVDPLLFARYYPDGNVKSAAEFTAGVKYTLNQSNHTAIVRSFSNNDNPDNPEYDNSSLVGRVVIPPFVDGSWNPLVQDDGTAYMVVAIGEEYIANAENSSLVSLVAPSTVLGVSASAFEECTSLVSVSLPCVTNIGSYAFHGCSNLKSAHVPAAMGIASSAFYGCYKLPSVSLTSATTIGESAFEGCTSLASVDFGATPRPSVPSLGANAFLDVQTAICKIIVPDAQYDAWTAASYWSDLVANGFKFLRHSEWEYARRYELAGKLDKSGGTVVGTFGVTDPEHPGLAAFEVNPSVDGSAPTMRFGDNADVVALRWKIAQTSDRRYNVVMVAKNEMGEVRQISLPFSSGTLALTSAIADKLDATSAAPAFSSDSSTQYAVGSHVTYNGKLYVCTTATTGGTWVAASWTADTMTDPDAVLDVTSQNQLRVVAKDGTVLWAQGYDLASTSSATLACDAVNNFTFADGATTQAFTLPTAPTGKVGDFGLDIDNSANTGAATMTLTGLDTTFSVIVPEGESLNDMLAIAAGELARFYITLTTFRVNNLPTWHIVKQVVENGGAQS